jgi:hypothetical protein
MGKNVFFVDEKFCFMGMRNLGLVSDPPRELEVPDAWGVLA